ncbi:hypothetical protein DMENIID0001_040270 [Sergentomyia squamirostris]
MEEEDENVNLHQMLVNCDLLEYKDQLIDHQISPKKFKRLRDEDIDAVFPIVGMRINFKKKNGKKLLSIHRGILPDVRKYKQAVAVGGGSQCISFFRRCWKSLMGKSLLAIYAKNQCFSEGNRHDFVALLVEHCKVHKIELPVGMMNDIATKIKIYYVPRTKDGNYSGKIYHKYHNERRQNPERKIRQKSQECQPDQAASSHENDDDALSVIKEDLQGVSEVHLSHEVLDKWKRTWTLRKMDLQENCHNFQAISKEWPLYLHEEGYFLITLDFETENRQSLSTRRWDDFKVKVVSFLKDHIKDAHNKSRLRTLTDIIDNDRYEVELLHLLHAVLVPTTPIRTMGSNRQSRATISDSQRRMILIPDDQLELADEIRSVCNDTHNGFLLPLIVFTRDYFLV